MAKVTKLGRLKNLGITEHWEVPLCCPVEYRDFTQYFESFDRRFLLPGYRGVFKGYLKKIPEVKWKNKKPRTQIVIHDGQESIMFSIFGDTRQLLGEIEVDDPIAVQGVIVREGTSLFLNNAEFVPLEALNTIMPIYKGVAGKIKPDNVRILISKHLNEGIEQAADKLRSILLEHIPPAKVREFVNCPSKTLEGVLRDLHQPKSMNDAHVALDVMTRISHLVAASELIKRSKGSDTINVDPLIGVDPRDLTKNIPFKPTDEQVMLAVDDIYHGRLLNSLLVGDVGTGKTVVYGLIGAYIASAGGRVGIMLPNQNLARQIYEELTEYFGEFGVGLVTGSAKEDVRKNAIVVGTTALLFRDVGAFNLVVCDEQQKMAISQREQLRHEQTHLLEVSATPIPRTMAFALYGAVKLLQLKQCHAKKTIHTKMFTKEERLNLMQGVRDTIGRGQKVLIVCARCEADEDNPDDPLISAELMFKGMANLFPNQVVISHSKMSDEENKSAIDRIKNGDAQILVSTTVVEVGMTIPELERVIIVNSERFGLQQLHQLRGRVVRKGGTGYCDLYLPNPVKNPDTIDRMMVMEECSDGFEIAKHDMEIRGTGDVGAIGSSQHGEYSTIIKGIKGSLRDIEATMELVEQLNEQQPVKKAS